MLTESEKKILEKRLKPLIKEAMMEDAFWESLFEKNKKDDEEKHHEKEKKHDKEDSAKRKAVMQWLDSALELHSVLSYKLFPNIDKDSARSEFSKKYNGEDANGKAYDFTSSEITKLYNMRSDYVNKAGLNKHNFKDQY